MAIQPWELQRPDTDSSTLRRVPRAQISGVAMLHHPGSDILMLRPLVDICVSGMAIEGHENLKIGHRLRIVIKADCLREPIQMTGVVLRIDPSLKRTAIEFVSISSRSRETIAIYVAEARAELALGGNHALAQP